MGWPPPTTGNARGSCNIVDNTRFAVNAKFSIASVECLEKNFWELFPPTIDSVQASRAIDTKQRVSRNDLPGTFSFLLQSFDIRPDVKLPLRFVVVKRCCCCCCCCLSMFIVVVVIFLSMNTIAKFSMIRLDACVKVKQFNNIQLLL